MSKTIEDILAPKPEVRPRIYAYSIADAAHKGLLKVGQTARREAACGRTGEGGDHQIFHMIRPWGDSDE